MTLDLADKTLSLKSRPNSSTPEIPVPFQKCLTFNLLDLYQCKIRVGCKQSCMFLQIAIQTIDTLLEHIK